MVPFGSGGGFSGSPTDVDGPVKFGSSASDVSEVTGTLSVNGDITGSALKLTGLPAGTGDGNSSFLCKSSTGAIVLSASAAGGGGNVSNAGSPANNQIAIFTDSTTIEGDADLTFDGATIGGKPGADLGAVTGSTLNVASGTFSSTLHLDSTAKARFSGTLDIQDSNLTIKTNSTNASFTANLMLAKSNNEDDGVNTLVDDHDVLGRVQFLGAGGDGQYYKAASIRAEIDGAPAAGDMPGRLIFGTSKDGQHGADEALRLNSSQEAHFVGDVHMATDLIITGSDSTITARQVVGGNLTGSSLNLSTSEVTIGTGEIGSVALTGALALATFALTASTARIGNLTSGRVVYATSNGQLTDDGDLTYNGTVLGGKPGADLGAITGSSLQTGFIMNGGAMTGSSLRLWTGDITIGTGEIGTIALTGGLSLGTFALTASTARIGNLTSGRLPYTTTNGQLTDSSNFTFDGDTLYAGGGKTLKVSGTFRTMEEGFIERISADPTEGPALFVQKTNAGYAIVRENEDLGGIFFQGNDNVDYGSEYGAWQHHRMGGAIGCFVDGTPAAGDIPSRLVFMVGNAANGNGYPPFVGSTTIGMKLSSSLELACYGNLSVTGSGKNLTAGAITGSSIKAQDPQCGIIYNIHSGSISGCTAASPGVITYTGHSLSSGDAIALLGLQHASGTSEFNSIRGIGNSAYFQHFLVDDVAANTFQVKAQQLATSAHSSNVSASWESTHANTAGSGTYVASTGGISVPWNTGTGNNCGSFCSLTTNTRGGTITLKLGAQLNQYSQATLYLYTNKIQPGDVCLLTSLGGNIGLDLLASEIHDAWGYFAISATNNSGGHMPQGMTYSFNWKLL
jgi:hypothetical protein